MQFAVEDNLPQPFRAFCTPLMPRRFSLSPHSLEMFGTRRMLRGRRLHWHAAAVQFKKSHGKLQPLMVDSLFFCTNMGGETVGIPRFQLFEGVE